MPSIVQFPSVLVACLERLLPKWKTALFLQLQNNAAAPLSEVFVKCGIFQSDTLSPLLFCLALNPFSYVLDNLSFCISLISYGFDIVEWTKAEITQFDVVRNVQTQVWLNTFLSSSDSIIMQTNNLYNV